MAITAFPQTPQDPNDKTPQVELKNVSFSYPIFEFADRSIKLTLARQFGFSARGPVQVEALKNVSLSFYEGDRVGLIGSNGSGKSTLLRLIGGLSFSTSGEILTQGRVNTIIDQSMGVNAEFSGADNIELPLRILGGGTEEIEAAKEDIREFAELGPFFDLPVRRYSDGMRARLAFAIATALPASVLVLDEWLGAGDANFVIKAEQRLNKFLDSIKTVVLASHSLELLSSVCNKIVWLERGEVRAVGEPLEVIEAYLNEVQAKSGSEQADYAASFVAN